MEAEARITMKDIATLLGVSAQTIRNYEKFNAQARYDFSGGKYRELLFESVSQLVGFRSLTAMGAPAREVSEILARGDLGSLAAYCADREQTAVQAARELELLASAAGDAAAYVELACGGAGAFEVVSSPPLYRLSCQEGDRLTRDAKSRELVREWGAALPVTFYAPAIAGPPFPDDCIATIGFGIFEKFAHRVTVDADNVQFYPSRPCIGGIGVVRNAPTARRSPEASLAKGYYPVIAEGLEFARQRGLEVRGPIIARLIASDVHGGDGSVDDYYYLWLPIE